MTFKEYVNQSAFEDWIYENICSDGNFKIDWEKEREWISDTAFTRQAVSNIGKKTFKPLSENKQHFDPLLPQYGGGRIVITVDKTGLITVTGSSKIRLNEEYVARVYVNRLHGRGINGVSEIYYDIPVSSAKYIYTLVNENKFIHVESVLESSALFNKDCEEDAIIINTNSIVDIQIYSYIDYIECIKTNDNGK